MLAKVNAIISKFKIHWYIVGLLLICLVIGKSRSVNSILSTKLPQ